jgi:FAD/FMN-containing dehydrogenase
VTSIKPLTAAVAQLTADIKGRVIRPDDPGYDQTRVVVAGDVDRRPAVIVRPADAADVACTVRVAAETGADLAVRSGGHSAVGHGVCDDGIVLDLRDLRSLDVDIDGRTAWAQTGLTAGDYTAAVGAHGLATGFGDTGTVGIGGITLGGGVGYLSRKHGLTVDDLLAAEIVTANGEILQVDEHTHPDLFWAIRGGGGNFGIATRFRFRLHEVRTVVGGMLMAAATPEVVAGFVARAEAAPDELSTIVNVMAAPPMPFIPAEHHGKLIVMALMCYSGPADQGERVIAPFRELATPLADMVRPIAYPEIYPPEDAGYRPTAVARTLFAESVDRDAAETILDRLRASDAVMRAVQLRVLGGAIARVPAGATAFAHRDRRIMVNVAAFFTGGDDRAEKLAWVTELAAAVQGEPGAYVNFLGDDGPERIREAYPGATWDRLAAVKRRYDPANLFRLNQNILAAPPTGA